MAELILVMMCANVIASRIEAVRSEPQAIETAADWIAQREQ